MEAAERYLVELAEELERARAERAAAGWFVSPRPVSTAGVYASHEAHVDAIRDARIALERPVSS